jgi:hypothetical protein
MFTAVVLDRTEWLGVVEPYDALVPYWKWYVVG